MHLNVNQKHEGVGHNIVVEKVTNIPNGINKELKEIPRWLKIIGIIFGIVGVVWGIGWAVFTYNKSKILETMNINQTHSGIGNNVVIVNPKDPPKIIEKRFVSTEPYLNGFKTQFILVVGNASQVQGFDVKIPVETQINFIGNPIQQQTGMRVYSGTTISYNSFLVSLFTNKKLSPEDFTFSTRIKNQ